MGPDVMMDWMIGTGLAVSLLIVLVLIVRRPFARMFGASAAYALWLLPFIRLVMPEVTIPRIFPSLPNTSAPEAVLPSEIVMTPDMITLLQAEPSLMSQILPYTLPAAFGIWAIGAALFFLHHWTTQTSLMDRLAYESELASNLKNELMSAAQSTGLKRIPQVRISNEKVGPLVAGFFRPVVMLPDNFMTDFSPAQRHYALMHEFMHIKRGDVWVSLAWLGFRAVNWPNPLVHYATKHFRSDQESACDASVLSAMGDSAEAVTGYAETLIHAAKAAMTSENTKGRAIPLPSQLALTIHHPLKERLMILENHRKTSNLRTRTAAAIMIIGAATLSAPLIQADNHPEEELAGKYQTHQGKSVIKRQVQIDGKTTSEHFEINVDGDDVTAFKIDSSGKKTRIDIKAIEDVDANILTETIAGSNNHSITIGDGLNSFPKAPKPPFPPGLSKHSENVFVFESDDFVGLKALKGLEGLEKLEALKSLKSLDALERLEGFETLKAIDGFDTFTVFSDGGDKMKLKLRRTQSKLAAVRAMLENTEVDVDDSREMAKAKGELEKARKALKAAEHALKDAE